MAALHSAQQYDCRRTTGWQLRCLRSLPHCPSQVPSGSIYSKLLLLVLLLVVGLRVSLSGLVGLLLGRLLSVLGRAPGLLGERLGLIPAVGDNDVVEEGASLGLPQLEAKTAEGELVQGRVLLELGVVDLRVHPDALVLGVVDALGRPLALVLRVGDGRGLPLAIVLVIPVLRLLGLRVDDVLGNVIPALRLLVLGVIDHGH